MAKWHGGKGSTPRPFSVDKKTFEDNWELAFGKKQTEEELINEISKLVAEVTLDDTETKDK